MKSAARTVAVLSSLFGCFLFCGIPANAAPPGFFPFQPDEEMVDLISQATALALIHNLALTPDQRKEIQGTLKPVRQEIELLQEEERAFRDERVKPRLRQVIRDLKEGRDPAAAPTEKTEEEMKAFRARMAGLFLKTDRARQAVEQALTPAQRERLRDFRFEEYMGPMPRVRPGHGLGMEPAKLIDEIRSASQEEIDAMVARVDRRREARKEAAGNGKRAARVDRKVETFVDLVRRIHAMPQEEFDARQEQLRTELEAVSPRGAGPGGRKGDGLPPGPPFADKRFDTNRILFSKAFYESL